jgi:hypothetical protein
MATGLNMEPESLPKYRGLPDDLPGRENQPSERSTRWKRADWFVLVLIVLTIGLIAMAVLPMCFGVPFAPLF